MAGIETLKNQTFPSPLILSCPACGKELKIIAHFQSNHIACACRRLLQLSGDGLKQVKKFEDYEVENDIPLASKGRLGGVVYQVVGFMHCKEQSSSYYWKEYILFNPVHGYATLAEFSGHWNLVKPKRINPELRGYSHSFVFDERDFRIFNKYRTEVVIGIGEFTSNVLKRHKLMVYEFISPPEIWIRELSDDEETWYHGEYLSASEIWSAFDLKSIPPKKEGIGATQPLKMSIDLPILKKLTILAVFLLICLQVINNYFADGIEVFNNSYALPAESEVKPIVSHQFALTGGVSNLEFDLFSNVQNEWFEAQITLINDETGEEYSFEAGVEYYFGYDGGTWSEGSQKTTKVLSSIPDGKYHLNIFPYKPFTSSGLYFNLSIKRDVLIWSNFFLFLFLILIYPIIQIVRNASFEARRWMNSDYSPN